MLMTKRLLIACALVCGNFNAFAQRPDASRVSGRVTDATTHKPVEYASVVLLRPNDSTVAYGMYTEPNGNFDFAGVSPGQYILRVTYMGYDKLQKPVSTKGGKPQVTIGTLKLLSAGKMLNTVEVKGEKPAFSMQIDRQVFDASSLVTAEGGTGADILKNVPSVEVDIDDNISLRGKSVTIFVDGKPSPFGDAKTALQMIPASTIDRVEVITNPSAKYEAQGGGGIINIVLKKDMAIGYNVMFNAGVATRGQLNGNANASLRLRRFNFFGNYYGWYNNQASSGYSYRQNLVPDSSNTSFFSQDNHGKNEDRGNGGRLGLDYYMNDHTTFTLSQGTSVSNGGNEDHILLNYLDAEKTLLRSGERNNNSHNANTNNNTALNFRHTTDKEGEELTAYVSYSNNKGNSNSQYNTEYVKPGAGTEDPNQQQNRGINQNQFWNAQSDYSTPLGKKGKLEAGVRGTWRIYENDYNAMLYNWDTDQYEKSNDLSNTYNYKENIYAAYTNLAGAFGNLGYQAGVRVEQADLRGFSFTRDTAVNNRFLNVFPSIFLKYNLPNNENQSLVFNYATRVDRPGFDQLLPFVNNSDPQNIRLGNPELKPSLTHKFEMNYSRYFPDSRDFLNGGVYYSQSNDDIDRISTLDTTTGITTTKPMNLATDQDWGSNVTYHLHIFRWWDVVSNLNLEYSRLTGAADVKNISNENFSYGMNLTCNLRLPADVKVQMQGRFRSPRVQAQGTFKAMNGMDIGIRKEMLKNKALAISLNISDVFNTQQFNSHYETATFIQDYDRKRTSRFVRVNVRYRFGKMDPNLFKKKKHQEEEEQQEGEPRREGERL